MRERFSDIIGHLCVPIASFTDWGDETHTYPQGGAGGGARLFRQTVCLKYFTIC